LEDDKSLFEKENNSLRERLKAKESYFKNLLANAK